MESGEDEYDCDGYDDFGYDEWGYNRAGYNRAGYNRAGYNRAGYDEDGYDEDGYNRYGYNRAGYNEDGYNEDGYDEDGYDDDGYNRDGYNRSGDQYCSDCESAPCDCSCHCNPPRQEFSIRNDGCEPLRNDTRVTIELPGGTISAEGLAAIATYLRDRYDSTLYDSTLERKYWKLSCSLKPLGDQWQTKNGNYTKRLSRHAWLDCQLKLTQDDMSLIGNIARDHSMASSADVEVTRDLNLPAADFYHEDSCWWGSYSESRCALKTNGGFGIRSFSGNEVTGRAWVMPLRKTEDSDGQQLVPTVATMEADAFIVFNGYGDLQGYTAARIVSHMAGWTYRRIDYACEPMYVNAGGYLITSEDIAQAYRDKGLYLSVESHSAECHP
jgi:hypothetical protein